MDSFLSFLGMIIVAIISLIGIIIQTKSHNKLQKQSDIVKTMDTKLDKLRAEAKKDDFNLNKKLDVEGVVLTMYDARTNLSSQVIDEVKKYFRDKVYKSIIPRNVKLSEAPSFGLPIALYDKNSKGAVAYSELAKEVIRANKIKV